MIGNYAGSIAVLSQAFPREQYGDTAAKLHDAFVYWRVGLLIDVKRSLKELAREHRESPIYGLLLGDLMQQSGAPEHSHSSINTRLNTILSEVSRWPLRIV